MTTTNGKEKQWKSAFPNGSLLYREVARIWYRLNSTSFHLILRISLNHKVFTQFSPMTIVIYHSQLSHIPSRSSLLQLPISHSSTCNQWSRWLSPIIRGDQGSHCSSKEKYSGEAAVCHSVVHHPIKPLTKHCAENTKHLYFVFLTGSLITNHGCHRDRFCVVEKTYSPNTLSRNILKICKIAGFTQAI